MILSSRRRIKGDGSNKTKTSLGQHAQATAIKTFLVGLRDNRIYAQLLTLVSSLRLPEDEVEAGQSESLTEDEAHAMLTTLCEVCWGHFEKSMAPDASLELGPLAPLRQELRKLELKLDECNLVAHKQISALKQNYEEIISSVDFYEPLQFLSPTSRQLVLRIVNEKLQQMRDGTAPDWLIHALKEQAVEDGAEEETLENLEEELQEQRRLKEERDRKRAALREEKERKIKMQMAQVASECAAVGDVQPKADVLRELDHGDKLSDEVSEAIKVQCQHLETENSKLRRQLAAIQQQLELATSQQVVPTDAAPQAGPSPQDIALMVEKRALEIADNRANNSNKRDLGEQRIKTSTKYVQTLVEVSSTSALKQQGNPTAITSEVEMAELQQHEFTFPVGQRKVRKSALVRPAQAAEPAVQSVEAVRCVSVQTDADDQPCEAPSEKVKHLTLVVEELRAKLADFLASCRADGLEDKVHSIARDNGLGKLLDSSGVFERLYSDAYERIGRLQRLQEQYKIELEKLALAGLQAPEPWHEDLLQAVEEPALISEFCTFWRFQGPFPQTTPARPFGQQFKPKRAPEKPCRTESPRQKDVPPIDGVGLGPGKESAPPQHSEQLEHFPRSPEAVSGKERNIPIRSWQPQKLKNISPSKSTTADYTESSPDLTLYSQTSTSFEQASLPRFQPRAISNSPSKRTAKSLAAEERYARQTTKSMSLPSLSSAMGRAEATFCVSGTSTGWR